MKVYKLIHKDGRFYIGSTGGCLSKRFYQHKINGLIKEFENDWTSVNIELIEKLKDCGSRAELNKKEQEYIDKLRTPLCLNKIRACRRTRHEEYVEYMNKVKGTEQDPYATHRKEHREENRLYAKSYYEQNKEALQQKARERYHSKKTTG